MNRTAFVLAAAASLAFVAYVALRASLTGNESPTWEAAQTAVCFGAALAIAAAWQVDAALSRSSIALGGLLICAALLLYETSQVSYSAAALPLASAGAYLLLLGCATAGCQLIAGIVREQR